MISREPTIERLAIAQRLLLEPFGLDETHLLRALAEITRPQGGRRRPVLPVHPQRRLEPGRGHRQDRQLQHRPGRGRARRERREDRLRLFRRHLRGLAAGRGAHRAHDLGRRRHAAGPRSAPSKIAGGRSLYQGLDPIATLDSTAKVKLLERVEKLARSKDPRVAQVMAGLASEYDVVMVARADGTLAADVRPLVRLSVTVIAEQNGRREMGSGGGGGRFGLALFRRRAASRATSTTR